MRGMADLLILDLLTIACSLPIFTIGPSLCALYSVTLRIAADDPVETARMFFSSFKENFKQGLILGLIALFGAVVIFSDGVYAFSIEGKARIFFCIVTGIIAAIWLTYVCYVFGLQARYENSVISQIKNAFLLAFVFPGKTILMWAIVLVPVLIFLCLPGNAAAYVGILYILFGVSLPAYGISHVLNDIFDRFDLEKKRKNS